MIEMAPPSFSLRVELGVAELITISSVGAVVSAALFNLGYFSLANWSYLSLLSPQDLLTGAFIAVPFAIGFTPMAIGFMEDMSTGNKLRIRVAVPLVFIFLVGAAIYDEIENDPFQYVAMIFALAFFVFGSFLFIRTYWPFTTHALLAFSSITALLPYIFGIALFNYDIARPEKHLTTISLKDGTQLSAKLLRFPTSYLFYLSGGAVVARRLEDITQVSTKMD